MPEPRKQPPRTEAEKSTRSLRIRVFFLMALFGVTMFVPLGMQLYTLQITRHDELEKKAIAQQTQRFNVTANRGFIYDRNMNVLVSSGSAETVGIDPPNIESGEQAELIARGLSDILGLEYEWVLERTGHKHTRNVTLAIKIDKEQSAAVREFIAKNKLERMIKLEPDSRRYYTYSNMASHVLGFVGRDNTGLDGLEKLYDDVLTGTPGHTIASVDTKGRIMPYQYEMYYDAQDGKGLVTTIDETIQHILDRCIGNAVAENEVGNRACGIVMDVKTGGILAMTTKGDFDPNQYLEIADDEVRAYLDTLEGEQQGEARKQALEQQWRNKTVSDTYEPGSTFKIITTAIAVETGCIDMEKDRFSCSGSINVGGWTIKCHLSPRSHGSQTFEQSLQNSCNPAFVQIMRKIGPEPFYRYMRDFGFMEKTGIDMMGEASNAGLYHNWTTFSTQEATQATYSFGQTFKITPLQMITGAAAVANGGYLMEPYVVSDSMDQSGVRQSIHMPTVVRQVVSQETSAAMRKLLEDAVTYGTGKNAYVKGYRVAGKTGTSQKRDLYDDQGRYIGDGKYVVSFVGFAPADDPQIAVLVMLDEPGRERRLRSGGWMAAPVAGRIFADVLPYLGVAPHYSSRELGAVDIRTPDVKGKSVTEAKDLLKSQRVPHLMIGDGDTVLDQIPPAGVYLPGTAEMLIFTEGSAQTGDVAMPNVLGMRPGKVNQALKDAGLFMRATGALPQDNDEDALQATFQSVEAGKMIPYGSIVEVEFRNASVDDAID